MCPWTLARSWEHLPTSFSFIFSIFLSFFLSLSLSLSFFLSLSLSLCLSFFLSFLPSFFLSFSFSFLSLPSCLGVPGCFRHSWEPFSSLLFSSLGVSLDACVVAGNTFFSFPFFFSSLLSLPLPPSRVMRSHTKEALQQVFNEVWLHRFSSPPFVSLFTLLPFTHICSPLFFHVLLSSCLSISFLLSFAHTSVPALVLVLLNPGFRSPRFSQ